MTAIWDGDTLADWIGQELTNGKHGFFPHGIGVPYAAQRAVCAFLREFEFANEVSTAASVDLETAAEVLGMAADLIEEKTA